MYVTIIFKNSTSSPLEIYAFYYDKLYFDKIPKSNMEKSS